jgi:[ribosomal protein S5]-alanine N-acetyltransferase
MDTQRLILFPHVPEYLRALAQGPEFYQAVSGLQVADGLSDFMRLASEDFLRRLQSATEPDPWSWGFAVVDQQNMVIGMAAFKGAPGPDRTVEIAYGISPAYQGRGYATEAALGLIRFARESGRVSLVCAHTLASNDPSMRVLRKCGFTLIGEVLDPEDGPVLRWELPL